MNKSIEGTFDFDASGNIIKQYLVDANLSPSEIRKLKHFLSSSVTGTTPPQVVVAGATAISPKLSRLFSMETIKQHGGLFAFLAILLQVIQIVYPNNQPSTTVVNNINNNHYYSAEKPESHSRQLARRMREKTLEEAKNKQDSIKSGTPKKRP